MIAGHKAKALGSRSQEKYKIKTSKNNTVPAQDSQRTHDSESKLLVPEHNKNEKHKTKNIPKTIDYQLKIHDAGVTISCGFLFTYRQKQPKNFEISTLG